MFDRHASVFKVKEPYDPITYQYRQCYKVNLSHWKCDCGEFQAKKLPCAHVFAACAKVFIYPCQFVDHIFRLDTIMNIYNNKFYLIGDAVHWPTLVGPRVVPDSLMICAFGRPKSTCIQNEMDLREGQEEPLRCGLCRKPGYNRGTCLSSRNNWYALWTGLISVPVMKVYWCNG